MKKSVKAALWSGLVFPGTGHFILKSYQRGLIVFVPAMISMGLYLDGRYEQVKFVWDKLESGAIPPDPISIAALLDSVPQTPVADVAFWVFMLCWVLGMVDAYRLGSSLEPKDTTGKNA